MLLDVKTSKDSLSLKLSNFLLKYRTTPTVATGVSPAKLIFNYYPKTLIDVMNSKTIDRENGMSGSVGVDVQVEKQQHFCEQAKKQIAEYAIGEIVSYQIVWSNFVKWVPAKICAWNEQNSSFALIKKVTSKRVGVLAGRFRK